MQGKTSNIVKELTTNTAFSFAGSQTRVRKVLVMDECDGMSAGDRGGIADLIQTIHASKAGSRYRLPSRC